MRRLVFSILFASFAFASLGAHAIEGCDADMSRLGFKDKDGKDLEIWKCDGGWRLSNLANEQAYINGDGKPCVKNSSTGQEQCCPQVDSTDKTDTKAKVEPYKESEWACVSDDPKAADKDKTILRIAPLQKNGSYASTVYRISGSNDSKDKTMAAKDKKVSLKVSIEVPTNSGPDKDGSINLESPLGSGDSGDNKCASKDKGSFCQLKQDVTGHNYTADESSKYVLQDSSKSTGGQQQAVKTDTTGKNAFSAR
ncbi:MAG: hypothetical protein ACXWQE_14120 [Bdellovibrionales bacterium]